jgi:hypothetical protein
MCHQGKVTKKKEEWVKWKEETLRKEDEFHKWRDQLKTQVSSIANLPARQNRLLHCRRLMPVWLSFVANLRMILRKRRSAMNPRSLIALFVLAGV